MKTPFRLATLVARVSALVICAATAQAQLPPNQGLPPRVAQPQSGGPPSVAVIDIGLIFKKHTRFQAQMEDMKKDLEKADTDLRAIHQQISQMMEDLKRFKKGTIDYNQREEEIARAQTDLQLKINLQKKDFMDREAAIYYNTYQEIVDEVAYFAERHGISLVLRFNGEQIDRDDRAGVLQGVNRAVVYQKGINISFDILDRLNQSRGPVNPGTATPGGPIPGGPIPRGQIPR